MIIEIRQVRSNGEGIFEIYEDNVMKYTANTAFMKVNLGISADKFGKMKFMGCDKNELYHAECCTLDNIKESLIPMKNILLGSQKTYKYSILDKDNNSCGCFYSLSNGMFDSKTVISYGDKSFMGYDVCCGRIRTVTFYDGDDIFAEMVKPLTVIDNLDSYYIYIKDSYKSMSALMAFFAVYYDYINYRHAGEYVHESGDIEVSYTFNKVNKYYDKNWIRNNFGEDAENIYLIPMKMKGQEINKSLKKILIIVGAAWASIALLGIILFFILI